MLTFQTFPIEIKSFNFRLCVVEVGYREVRKHLYLEESIRVFVLFYNIGRMIMMARDGDLCTGPKLVIKRYHLYLVLK